MERTAGGFAEGDVGVVDGVEGDEFHLFDSRLSVRREVFISANYVQDVGDDIAPGGRLVELLADPALEGHGEHVEHRCVGVPPLGGTPAGAGYFVRMTFAADHAHIVGGGEG